MTTPQPETQYLYHGYPERPVPDIFGGADWDFPMTDRYSSSIFLIVEYLKIVDPENANEPTAYKILSKLNDEHKEMDRKVYHRLRENPGDPTTKNQAFQRLMFQFLQHQVSQLVAEALEVAGGNPAKLVGMMRYHFPAIERAQVNDAVMKVTVEEALKTLGRDHSPAAVDKLWLELNQEVDLRTDIREVQRLAWWATNVADLPRTAKAMERIFLQDQNAAAWEVIDQYLTEPINALMEQQEEEDPWAVDWD